jgi:hypothetical protein
MLDAQFANALKLLPQTVRDAFGWLEPRQEPDYTEEAVARLERAELSGDDEFPAIVRKAQEDVLWRKALARLGYSQVRASYAAHKQEGLEVFAAIADRRLRPPMDFVRDWLREERTRIIDQVRWLFYVAMLATVLAGATFVATIALLG